MSDRGLDVRDRLKRAFGGMCRRLYCRRWESGRRGTQPRTAWRSAVRDRSECFFHSTVVAHARLVIQPAGSSPKRLSGGPFAGRNLGEGCRYLAVRSAARLRGTNGSAPACAVGTGHTPLQSHSAAADGDGGAQTNRPTCAGHAVVTSRWPRWFWRTRVLAAVAGGRVHLARLATIVRRK